MYGDFPIYEIVDELKEKLNHHQVVILQAPPGAGKSTILPLELLKIIDSKIIMLEPRRLAARSVATRMASLLDEEVGETVGYRVRFENKTSAATKLEVVTEGILTRMMQDDNALEEYGLVIFDEFHERSIHADLALSLSLQIQEILRTDLKILIMSATLDSTALTKVLGNVPVITSSGRQYPVKILYEPGDKQNSLTDNVSRLIKKALLQNEGDILVFLPGAGEILRTSENLIDSGVPAEVFPLYGDLTFAKQQEAIMPDKYGRRKVVLATNIAETSLTIEGISVVIDSGVSRIPKFDPRSGLTKLETVPVSLDAADQRAGRAGRLGPGVCYRMWNEASNAFIPPQRVPEILDADLAPLVLDLYNWGLKDPNALKWITPPPQGSINQANDTLEKLNAVANGNITADGKKILSLPTHPRVAHLLNESEKHQLTALASDVSALLEERDFMPKNSGADLTLRIELLRKYRRGEKTNADRSGMERVERLSSYWRKYFRIKEDNNFPNEEDVGFLIAAAYPERIAKQREKGKNIYRLSNGRSARLEEQDPLSGHEWIAVSSMDAGTNEGKIFMAAPVNPNSLDFFIKEKIVVGWDKAKGEIISRKEFRIGELIWKTATIGGLQEEKQVEIICELIRNEGLSMFPQWEEVQQLQARVESLRKWRTEENWPDYSDEGLLSSVDSWFGPYAGQIRKADDFKKIELYTVLKSFLPWELQSSLDVLAPSGIDVPSGSSIKLEYKINGESPVLAVRLQEMFGLAETPVVNEGKIKVLLHLLSPGYKPVQVTQDLKSFWNTTYREVKKELKIRYPKHSWPEDPWTAEAVRGVKRNTR